MLWGDEAGDSTWYWGLDPLDEHRTRLSTRVRMHYRWTSPLLLFNPLVEFTDIVMMRKCLLGIKRRAEASATQSTSPITGAGWPAPRVGRFELARVRPGAPISHSPTARLGFWSAVLAASASLVFLVASGPVLLGAVAPPWDNILTLVPSLVLAPALLVLLVCVHHTARSDRKVWSHLAVAFAGVYTALVSVVYVVELAVVEPLIVRGNAARAGLLTIEPGGVLNAIDGLGYAFLGLALLFAAPVFAGGGLDRLIRWLLFANGVAVVPILLTYFVDRAFLLIAGPLWGLAVPAVAVLLAVSFRRAGQSPDWTVSP